MLLDDPARKAYRGGRVWTCEGQGFLEHDCLGGIELNEIFFTRRMIQSLPDSRKRYFWDELNSVLNCSGFHHEHGHSTDYRDYVFERHGLLYGRGALKDYLLNAPLKENVWRKVL